MGKINNDKTRARYLFDKQNVFTSCEKYGIVVCYQFRTPENIGNVIRLASNFGCQKVIVINKDEEMRRSKIKKLAGAAFDFIQIEYFNEDEFWNKISGTKYTIIAVETSLNSKDISKINLPNNAIFILGNERTGLSNEIVDRCDLSVYIPMFGDIKSMNVSHACAVALYKWRCS